MSTTIKTLSALADSDALRGKRVFIRSDLNVPLQDGRITEDTRVRASVPAIRMALDAGAAVMVTSHLGRPTEGEFTQADSLAPVAQRLSELLGMPVELRRDWLDGVQVSPGQVVLLENCRCNVGEKKNNPELARKMAALCDVYVNDAFGTAHRAEATTEGIARFAPVACAGPLLEAELTALGRALHEPARPLVVKWSKQLFCPPSVENIFLHFATPSSSPSLFYIKCTDFPDECHSPTSGNSCYH